MIAFDRTLDVVHDGLLFGRSEALPFGRGVFAS